MIVQNVVLMHVWNARSAKQEENASTGKKHFSSQLNKQEHDEVTQLSLDNNFTCFLFLSVSSFEKYIRPNLTISQEPEPDVFLALEAEAAR